MKSNVTRRTFAQRLASVFSTLGVAATALSSRALAQSSGAQESGGIRKLNAEGKPGEK